MTHTAVSYSSPTSDYHSMCPLTGVGTERTRTPHVCRTASCALVYLTPLRAHYPSLTTPLFCTLHPLERTGIAWTRENETKISRSNARPPGYLMPGGRGGFRAVDNLITEPCVSKSCSGRRRQRSSESEGTGTYFSVRRRRLFCFGAAEP